MILSFTCKWINQSKGMSTKQYKSKKNQKQTQETKHNIAQNMFKVKRGRDKDKTLIKNLKKSNFQP